MANNDWAIMIGVRDYPDPQLGNLDGPDNDVKAFRDWLIDPVGGNVPRKQVIDVTTSGWTTPFRSVGKARPTTNDVLVAGEKVKRRALLRLVAEGDCYLGRRLYLYMAGHGFAPREDETALLMANATKINLGSMFHWLGEYTADWFYRAAAFDEIMLFMDCCREIVDLPALNLPWKPVTGNDFDQRGKRFYAFATRWSRKSRERTMDDGKVHGVFTWTLLEGLRGQASIGGEITTQSLKGFLENNMKDYLSVEMRNSDDVPKVPYVARADPFVVVANVRPPTFPVTVHLPAATFGKRVEIFGSPGFTLAAETVAVPPTWQVPLQRGLYLVLVDGLRQKFEVPVPGGNDVRF